MICKVSNKSKKKQKKTDKSAYIHGICIKHARNHCKYVKSENGDLVIEDISQFGTFLDGEKLVPGQTYSVRSGSKVGLCNVGFVVMEVNE